MLSFIANRNLGRAAVGAGLLAASVACGQVEQRMNAPRHPGVIEHFEFPGGTLESFVEHLQAEGEVFANVLYRNGAKSVEVPAIELQNVHYITAISATLLDIPVHFQTIQTGGMGSEVTVFTGREQADSTSPAKAEATTTEILHAANLFGRSEEMDEVLEVIDAAVFDERHPERQPDIRFHEQSGLLIVRGTESQVEIVKEVVEEMDRRNESLQRRELQHKSGIMDLEARIVLDRTNVELAQEQIRVFSNTLEHTRAQKEAGVVTSRDVDLIQIEVARWTGVLETAVSRLQADQAKLQMAHTAYETSHLSQTYICGAIPGGQRNLITVVSAMRLLSGPPMSFSILKEGEVTFKATKAEHEVIAAILNAMKTAAGQGQD